MGAALCAPEKSRFAEEVAVVTGGSQGGIGFHVCRQLLAAGVGAVVLTSRSEAQLHLATAALKAQFPERDVLGVPVEVTDQRSVDKFVRFVAGVVRELGVGGVSMLIQNTGVLPLGKESKETAANNMAVNYGGARRVFEGMGPLLLPNARVVGLGTTFALPAALNCPAFVAQLGKCTTLDQLDTLAGEYVRAFANNERFSAMMPSYIPRLEAGADLAHYGFSKALFHRMCEILAVSRGYERRQVTFLHPGLVDTRMTASFDLEKLSIEVGARGPVMLALDVDSAYLSGTYYDAQKDLHVEQKGNLCGC